MAMSLFSFLGVKGHNIAGTNVPYEGHVGLIKTAGSRGYFTGSGREALHPISSLIIKDMKENGTQITEGFPSFHKAIKSKKKSIIRSANCYNVTVIRTWIKKNIVELPGMYAL